MTDAQEIIVSDSVSSPPSKLPPANLEAEQALLGAILTNNRAYEYVSDFLHASHFADRINGDVFQAIGNRIEAGQLADPVTMRNEFESLLENHGGLQYVADLMNAMVGIVNARDYGQAIHDCWIRRELIDIGSNIVNDAHSGGACLKGADQISSAEESLFKLATDKGQSGTGFTRLKDALKSAVDTAEHAFNVGGEVVGLTSGLADLDKKIGGLHPSDLIILAGRPAMGKTALAVKVAFEAARSLRPDPNDASRKPKGCVAFFSLEMSAEQLGLRILSDQAGIPGERIRRGDVSSKDFHRFTSAVRELALTPLEINDTPALPVSAVRTQCRRLHRTKGLKLIVIDYLQLLRPAVGTRSESRVLEVSMITQALKALAKELDVPVIALSQLSRQVESREDKRPMLADLRESGSIEQDADMVMFIYRDAYYLQQREPKATTYQNDALYQTAHNEWTEKMSRVNNVAELIIEKQRHGPTGTVLLDFDGQYTRFSNRPGQHA